MRKLLQKFRRDEDGAAMAEYAVLIGLITLALVAVITPFSAAIQAVFTAVTKILATV